jgi:hypothetical protein
MPAPNLLGPDRQKVAVRVIRAAMALWTTLFVVQDAHWASACHHHGSVTGRYHGAGYSAAETSEAEHPHEPEDAQGEQASDGPCQCPGMCASASPIAVAALASASVLPAIEVEWSDTPELESIDRPTVSFLIPFATAPPSA